MSKTVILAHLSLDEKNIFWFAQKWGKKVPLEKHLSTKLKNTKFLGHIFIFGHGHGM